MFIKYNLFGILWAGIILFLSLTAQSNFPDFSWEGLLTLDKAAHLFFYAVLVVLLITGFLKQYTFRYLRKNCYWLVMLISIGYGVSLELMQALMAQNQRMFEVADILANTAGSITGITAFFLVYKL